MALPSFAVIIPMYNEQAGAEDCVRRVCTELARFPHRSRLIVVNDGSQDGTGALLRGLERLPLPLTVVPHPRNRGYGAALRTGMCRAMQDGFQYVLFMDSDLTNDPRDIAKFVARMEEGFDVIKASRYIQDGRMEGVPFKRAVISRTGNLIARVLFGMGLKDCTNGFRAVKTSILAQMDLREAGFPIIMEELYHCKFRARRFCEVPVVLTNRQGEKRGTSFTYKPRTFLKYLKFGVLSYLGVHPASRGATRTKGGSLP